MKDIGLLVLRVGLGSIMVIVHGLDKLLTFSEKYSMFPDPMGVGSKMSLSLAIFAEFLCALLVLVGFYTRIAAFFVAFTMFVAAFAIHAADPWSKKELAMVYLICFVTLAFTGGGKYSLGKGKFS